MSKKFFRRYSWGVVVFTVLVILWGAVVRATGSGAGCGSHWPLCNGEVVPQLAAVETAIELFHRFTSALDGVLVILLVWFAYRSYGRRSNVTRWAFLALVFIIIEGLLGRLLVVREWVAGDTSAIRAVVVAIHLMNTYILLLTMVATAWLASVREEIRVRDDRKLKSLLVIGLVLTALFSALGAVTALGDTLFPPESVLTEIQKDLDPSSHFLIRLRVIHPVFAVLTGLYLYFVVLTVKKRELGGRATFLGNLLFALAIMQGLAGGITILTLAPLYMQIIHLLLADVFWITLVLFSAESITEPARRS